LLLSLTIFAGTGFTVVTPDATCGSANGYTCPGSQWGNCCGRYGWCGSTDVYCGAGCQPAYGFCG
ncbi:carbohydrate-binding module family 18 protein, partial [Patellaria atrata CBS 101060]